MSRPESKSGNPPTPRQRQVYDLILARIESDGYPPSVREIAVAIGVRSPNGVTCHIDALVRKGLLDRERGKGRAIYPAGTAGRPTLDYPGDDLTPRQREAFDFIRAGIEAKGYPPTLREIGRGLGVAGLNAVAEILDVLERKGAIVRDRRKSRAIRLVGNHGGWSMDDVTG